MKKFKKERRVNLMKKISLFVLFLLSGIGIYFLVPQKVLADSELLDAGYLHSYLTQYQYGLTSAEILTPPPAYDDGETFFMYVDSTTLSEIDQDFYVFNLNDLYYFESRLADVINMWVDLEFQYPLDFLIDYELEIEDFDGMLYWNFLGKYWQIEYYETTEIEYYIQRINYLENLVSNLSNDLYLRGIEIHELQIEIQNLEDLLDTEFDRGYVAGLDDGYDVGYDEGIIVTESEAYEQGFKAGQKSKLAENNEKFYNGIEKWLVPAIITVIALGGFVTIASIKRREQ